MSVDKFGRHVGGGQCSRGLKGGGFDLTNNGNFNINNKRLCNVANAEDVLDSVNLQTLQESIACSQASFTETLKHSFDSYRQSSDTIVEHLKINSLLKNDKNGFDANHAIISNLSKPKHWYDAVHYKFFIETLADLSYAIYSQLNKKKQHMSKKEWLNVIVHIRPTDWDELFSFKESPYHTSTSVEDKISI